jgi:hypothetical protein
MATAENRGQEIGNFSLAHTKFSSFPVYSTFLILNSMRERENLRGASFILSRNPCQIKIQFFLKHDRHVYRFYILLCQQELS